MVEQFSVAMCVYGGDNPQWFDRALESVIVNQIVKPKEVVLVVDGPISEEIESVIEKYDVLMSNFQIDFKVIRFETNQGHGNARRASVDNTTYNLVALMDADDISVPNRFEKELELFEKDNPDVVGGNISEFIGDENNVIALRKVPKNDEEIKIFAKSRCPMNQMTVMFSKHAYFKAGGYIDWYQDEDYYLWIRMILQGAKFANSDAILCNVRVGKDMYARRGGWKYFKSERRLQKYMRKVRFIGFFEYIINCSKRFIVQVLMPNKLRAWAFRKFARK